MSCINAGFFFCSNIKNAKHYSHKIKLIFLLVTSLPYLVTHCTSHYIYYFLQLNVQDWNKCQLMFKVYQTMFRIVKDSENVDERQHCFLVQTSGQDSRYFSVETRQELLRIENAWHCSVCTSVMKLGVRFSYSFHYVYIVIIISEQNIYS